MSGDRRDRVSEIFLSACEIDPTQRAAFLDRACSGDIKLRAEVESLLAHDDDGSGALRTGGVAAHLRAVCRGCGAAWDGESECRICQTRETVQLDRTPRIPGYEILRLLGEGGMGRVFLAREVALGRRVAIKVVTERLVDGDAASGRFAREARAMAAVEHPHVVRLYSFGENAGRHHLVMEYVEGQSLAERIGQSGALDVDQSLRVLRQAVSGLNAMWKHGIVHRDVKPSNMLMDAEEQVRLADFGLAKGSARSDLSSTDDRFVFGTPHYISPEQARGDAVLDFRTDVYSLGIVLYEMLTGKPPYDGATPLVIIDQHLHAPMPSIRSPGLAVSDEVQQLCREMSAKRPTERPASYEELLVTIDSLLERGTLSEDSARSLPSFLTLVDEDDAPQAIGSIFVGREPELSRLNGLLDGAMAGDGRIVFVTGEAGTGKTWLINEFASRSQQAHGELIVARGHCNSQTGVGDPYGPFRELLNILAGDVEARRAHGVITRDHGRRLWELLPRVAQALLDTGPDLLDRFVPLSPLISRAKLFSPAPVPWRTRLEQLAECQRAPTDVALDQSNLFDQYAGILQTLEQRHPLLLEIEDLHWADAGSCAMLFHLTRWIRGRRVLILATYRPTDVSAEREGRRHPLESVVNEVKRQLGDVRLHLGQEAPREFVEALVDCEPNELKPRFREAIYRHTRGHPLFTVELVRSMKERGMLVRNETGHWVESADVEWETLPARVEGVIEERIGRLPDRLQKALTLASVQGEEFAAEVLASVLGEDPRELIGILADELARQHRLIIGQGTRRLNGARICLYRFRHALFQKYLYHRLDEAELAYSHDEVGTVLERLYGDQSEEIAADLARHFERAGVADKAIDYSQQAGRRAVRLMALGEAIAHYTRGLGLLDRLPGGRERAQRELDLQLALGVPLLMSKGPGSEELHEVLVRSLELCQQLDETASLFPTLFGLINYHAAHTEFSKMLELANQMLDAAEQQEDPRPRIMAHWARAFTSLFLARFDETLADLDRVIELYLLEEHDSLRLTYGFDPCTSGMSFKANVLWYLGRSDQAAEWSAKALALARRLDHPNSSAHALTIGGFLAGYGRDVPALEERAAAVRTIAEEKRLVFWNAWALILEGWVQMGHGRHQEGIERMSEGLDSVVATGSRLGLPDVVCQIAQAHRDAGNVARGLRLASEGLEMVRESGAVIYEAELSRVKGELLLDRAGGAADAEACFRHAIEVARGRGSLTWELRAAMSLGRLWKRQDKKQDARELVNQVYGRFTEGFGSSDLKEAETFLARLA